MKKRFVYADNAATTAISPYVLEKMLPFLTEQYGNASAVYSKGRKARTAVETAREQIAAALSCSPEEIFFTSGGTESDNWAIRGVCQAAKGKNHIITSSIEHHAVLNTCRFLGQNGYRITYIPVDSSGTVNPDDIEKAIAPDTALVSIMYACNETGVIQPVSEIGNICRKHAVPFHTDAVQAAGHLEINVNEHNISLLSISGHKIHAPKGTGALYIRKGTNISNLMFGGAQENSLRPGTENTAAIVGLGAAFENLSSDMDTNRRHAEKIRNRLESRLSESKRISVNGISGQRLPGISNITVKGADGEQILLMLDLKGICASAGSACTSGSSEPSHVLKAMGLSDADAYSSLRFSFGHLNSADDADYIADTLNEILRKL